MHTQATLIAEAMEEALSRAHQAAERMAYDLMRLSVILAAPYDELTGLRDYLISCDPDPEEE